MDFKNGNKKLNVVDKLIDIHLNGDIDLKRIAKDDYDILYCDHVLDIDYNYAFLKNNNVNIEDLLENIKKDLKKLNRKPAIYILSNIMSDNLKTNNLEINHTDTWMILDTILDFTTNLNVEYSRLAKDDLEEFIETFMNNFANDDPNEPYQGLAEGYRKTFSDNYKSHDGFKSIYYVGKLNNKIICTTMGIYKDDSIILYAGSVNKELRGKGIFKEFLNYIVKDLQIIGITNICLQTEKGYYPERLYFKMGFKEVLQGTFYNIK